MKHIILITLLGLIHLNTEAQCTLNRFCLSYANPQIVMDGTQYEVDLVVSSNADFGLGSSNLQFEYNNDALSSPVIISTVIGSPDYQTPSITTPFIPSLGKMVGSLNIELNTSDNGMNIPTAGLRIARLRFNIIDENLNTDFTWYYDGGTAKTIVYDDNESTQLCAVDPGTTCLEPLSTALPLDLLSLNSESFNNAIDLQWQTANEINTSHFEIERSTSHFNFTKIGKMSSQNLQSVATYNYTDKDVQSNTIYYYRLKMVDRDGRFQYSNTISDRIDHSDIIFEVYPNPTRRQSGIDVRVSQSIEFNFILLDSRQNILMSQTCEGNTKMDLESYNAGMYFYQITYADQIQNGKLIIH